MLFYISSIYIMFEVSKSDTLIFLSLGPILIHKILVQVGPW